MNLLTDLTIRDFSHTRKQRKIIFITVNDCTQNSTKYGTFQITYPGFGLIWDVILSEFSAKMDLIRLKSYFCHLLELNTATNSNSSFLQSFIFKTKTILLIVSNTYLTKRRILSPHMNIRMKNTQTHTILKTIKQNSLKQEQ